MWVLLNRTNVVGGRDDLAKPDFADVAVRGVGDARTGFVSSVSNRLFIMVILSGSEGRYIEGMSFGLGVPGCRYGEVGGFDRHCDFR